MLASTKKRTGPRPLGLLLAGLLQAVGVCWPLAAFGPEGQSYWWLQMLALGWLFRSISFADSASTAFRMGLWFSTAWLLGTFWWLFISMHTYGGLHALLAATAVLLLAGVLALYYASAMAVYVVLRPEANSLVAAVLFSTLWVLAELGRGILFTGFGWGAIGYAHIDGPLALVAPYGGAYAVAFVAALFSSLIASKEVRLWRRATILMLLVLTGNSKIAEVVWSKAAGSTTVSLLQGNIAQDEKFMPGSGIPQSLSWYGSKLIQSRGDLVVAPETAIPLLPSQLEPEYWKQLKQRFATGETMALIGIPLETATQGYTNSVIGLQPARDQIWRYDKYHLVPFGEFIPPGFKWFTRMMNIPLGDFDRGPVGAASIPWKGQRLALNICYEDLFGEELGARFLVPDSAPTLFVNVSNIAWFGKSVAIDQHLQISRMRAIEFERPFVRATNTGATVIIDHRGAVKASLPYHSPGILTGTVEGRTGLTPYAWWVSRFGLWPLWLLCGTIVLWAWLRRRRY